MQSNKLIKASWEDVNAIKDSLLNQVGNNWEQFKTLESIWQKIHSSHKLLGSHIPLDGEKSPLYDLCSCINENEFSPPELMIWLLERVQEYFDGGGALELEDIFFGNRTKGLGNEAARVKKESTFEFFNFYIRKYDKSEEPMIYKAEKFLLDMSLEIDPDNFLRSYRRGKK